MIRHTHAVAFASLFVFGSCSDSGSGTAADDTAPPDDTFGDGFFGDLGEVDAIDFDTAVDTGRGDTTSSADIADGDLGPDGTLVPGGFGYPCQRNADCSSGFCVEGPEGFVCTKTCESECPTDYDCRGVQSGSADTVFLCMPQVVRVCVPCKADYQCPGGACLDIGGTGECSYPCDDASACPDGYVCEADAAGTHAGSWCRPRSGSCDCTPDLAGAVRTCTSSNAFGTCYGTESCDAALGWVGCTAATAAAEVCDGRDNDCDALVDDGVAQGEPCDNTVAGVGTCHGVTVCVGTDGLVCTAATPEVEVCDFRDNDCDGQIDEPFKDADGGWTLPEHCGTCNNDCSDKIANGTGRCEVVEGASPVCVVAACDADYVELNRFQCALPPDVSCLPCAGAGDCYDGTCAELDGQRVCVVPCGAGGACQDGYECRAVGAGEADADVGEERCMPVSGSCLCNPTTDGSVRTCVRASVSGTCYGQEVCDAAAGWSGCTAHVPSEEVCNGVDDDCSSAVDDVLGRGDACAISNTFGTCAGVRDCADGAALECVGPTPAAEICNYDDDDCDGQTDEGFPTLYAVCATGIGACERYGFVACRPLGDGVQCNATAGAPSDEKCDGVDNDCDSETDETFGDLGDVCFTGVGACRGVGTVTCTANGSGTACNAVAGDSTVEACDLIDNDCDGVTDNGFKNAAGNYVDDQACGNCFTDCTAIYDKPHAAGDCAAGPPPFCRMVCDANHFDLNEVPDDGCELALDAGAIYVGADSAGAADDASCGLGPHGTGGHPCASIGYGIGRAQALGRTRVLVADALYVEQVILVNGISLFGAYRADTWERHVASTTTTLRGPDGTGDRKAIVAIGITSATAVEGFVINAANAVSVGANSYAVYVRNSSGALDLHDNLVFAGLGGPGSTGVAGTSGDNGVNGTAGLPTIHTTACSGSPGRNGGAGGTKSCPALDEVAAAVVNGGSGGASVCPGKNIHEGSGTSGSNGGGAGGSGGWGHNSYTDSCSPSSLGPEVGVPGVDAPVQLARDGAAGLGCSDVDGGVTNGEWRGVAGAAGGHGLHGAGGGGGGAGSGGWLTNTSWDISGTGGGGGSGGCAGARGGGGQPGGGSFGVFIAWTTGNTPLSEADVPQVHDNVISRNQGGPGGAGGNGGAGGDPGQGALGGALTDDHSSPIFCVFGGAKGGYGSRGGHGGGGGGGCGGASFDVFVWGLNGVSASFTDNVFANGDTLTGGDPGVGGNSSNTTRKGFAGQRGDSGRIKLVN